MVLPWKPGLLRGCIGPYFISATRFTYGDRNTHLRALGQSLRVRARWPYIADSVGLSAKADFRSRSLYLLSVWLAYADLQQWVRSEHHAVLVDRYRTRLTGTAYEGWTSETFDLASSWRRALERLRTCNQQGNE